MAIVRRLVVLDVVYLVFLSVTLVDTSRIPQNVPKRRSTGGPAECKRTANGIDYRGHVSKTVTGLTCQRWDSQYPHEHIANDADRFPDAVYNEKNYCRNPDHGGHRPYCLTTDPDVRWEYCYIPDCQAPECKASSHGMDYRGNLSTTRLGRTCQRWDSQYPHAHRRNDQSLYPDAAFNDANYCRNPDRDQNGPWCFTTDPYKQWEYCIIPDCEVQDCKTSVLGLDYRGKISTTVSGRTCQRWDSQSPWSHQKDDQIRYPDAAYNEANYCRNPDHDSQGPWCFTTDPNKQWEYCQTPTCKAKECKTSTMGNDYRGEKSTTVSGRTCQRWYSQYPHRHRKNDQSLYVDAAYNEENYCRNPDHKSQGPWCYTTDPSKRWEFCAVPDCDIDKNDRKAA